MEGLNIKIAENGFIVYEDTGGTTISRQWAFETAHSLAEFIHKWGEESMEPVEPKKKS